MAITYFQLMLEAFSISTPRKGLFEMLGKNTLNVMFGVIGGVIVAEYILKKTPVGSMLGLTA